MRRAWIVRTGVFLCAILAGMTDCLTDPPQQDWPPRILTDPYVNITAKCQTKFGITKDQIRIFSSTPEMYETDRNLKCYIHCAYNENGAILPTGKLDKVKLLKLIEQLSAEEQLIMLNMGKLCLAQKEKDMCDRMYGVAKCMKLSDPVHFYLI